MNNKGQTLVLFVLLLPEIILILFMVFDIGKMINMRSELDSINYLVVDYALEHLMEDDLSKKLKEIISQNRSECDAIIQISDDKIEVILKERGNLLLIKKSKILRVTSSYRGKITDGVKVIERING